MGRSEYMNLSIRKERYETLKKEFVELGIEKSQGIKFTEWVANELEMAVSKMHFLRRFAPAFFFVAVHENSILIRDDKAQSIVQITIRGNQLHCNVDKGNDCLHIHYALALSALGEIVDIKPKKE